MAKKIKIGLIRVITTSDEKILSAHAQLLVNHFHNFCIETKCIPDQPEGIHDVETEATAIPKIIKLAKEFEDKGCDAILVSCAADPGVEECRKLLRIPVIGAGSACALVAYGLGNRIGVLGITDEIPLAMASILRDKLCCRIKPKGVTTTLDLLQKDKQNVLDAADYLKEKGCDVIALGCTGMSTINIREDIEKNVGVRVVDPVLASGLLLNYLAL